MEKNKAIKAYKGFNQDLNCKGFQYEVGKEYEMGGNIECCKRGFHACESPLEVFDHYDMLSSRFAEVEQSGEIDKEKDTTKVCSSKIKIKAELKLADIINLGIEWLKEITSPTKVSAEGGLNDNGNYSAKIGSSGVSAKIESSGEHSVVMAAGHNSCAKAKKGSWIALAEWKRGEDGKWMPVCVKTEQVDGGRIKADAWYKLIDGEFKEVNL